jgi:hypothetical protein
MVVRHVWMRDWSMYGFATSMKEGWGPTRAVPCSEGVAEGMLESKLSEGVGVDVDL